MHDVIAALRYARSRAHSEVRLVGLGRGAGAWAAMARGMAPSLVDRAAIDTGGFRFASVATLDDAAFLPGGAKYDDLPGALAVAAPGPLWLAGEGRRVPAVVDAAYRAAGAARAVTLGRDQRRPARTRSRQVARHRAHDDVVMPELKLGPTVRMDDEDERQDVADSYVGPSFSLGIGLQRFLLREVPLDHPLRADRLVHHVRAGGGAMAEERVLERLLP